MANFKTVNVELSQRECQVISLAVDTLLHLINDEEVGIDTDTIDMLHSDLVGLQIDGFTLEDDLEELDEDEADECE